MTLSEKIEHERAVAEANRKVAEFEPIDDVDSCIVANCIKLAEEHEQYASWLEELSRRRVEELFRKTDEKAIRDKTIDDFVNACKDDILCQTFGLRQCDIEKIAERLKEGANSD